ncbi:MAG: SDR family oxidoreductase [Prochlorococcus sp.]
MLINLVKRCQSLPPNATLLVLGGGYTGQHVAALTRALGNPALCTRRNQDQPGADLIFDSSANLLPAPQLLKDVSHVLSCIPPDQNGQDPVLTSLGPQLRTLPLQWVGYLSTTGVYGDRNGEWVKETDPPQPKVERSKRRLQCEQAWLASELPVQILRLPGIYGPGRSALDVVKSGKCRMIHKPEQVFSRVHIDDIAGAVLHLIHLAAKGQQPAVVNVADDLPSPSTEQLRFAAELIGAELPAEESFDTAAAAMSAMSLSFWQENRRVSNQLLCRTLGYQLMHANYSAGLRDIVNLWALKGSITTSASELPRPGQGRRG